MGYLWVMTIGFVICLGMAGAAFMYGIFSSFNLDDASTIDLHDTRNEDEKT
ncbi:hypothetical protein V7201_03105 [Bacillus sp. JJ1122]|uniref:hypothetical protein n=1 Tax=Bacillus sp. JJ1122 TaxID=3122951 RepID=UPI002FFF7662